MRFRKKKIITKYNKKNFIFLNNYFKFYFLKKNIKIYTGGFIIVCHFYLEKLNIKL